MSQIKYAGTYRGIKVDAGVSKTTNGHVQLVVQLVATECYDFETEQWVEDWQQYDETHGSEITGYLMLFSKDVSKEAFQTAKQLQKAWGWGGNSLVELEQLEPESFQFKVIEDEYEGKKRLKVAWIDAYDAIPGGTIQKLDESELKKLNAKYANALRKLGGGPKPKAVPQNKPAKPPIPGQLPKTTTETSEPTVDDAKAAMKAKHDERAKRGKAAEAKAAKGKKKQQKPPKPPAPPVPPKVELPKQEELPEEPLPATSIAGALGLPAECTAEEAWEQCFKNKRDDVSDVQISEIWVKTTEDLGGADAIDDWATVRDIVLEQTANLS